MTWLAACCAMVARIWRALIDAAPVKIWAQIGAAMVFTLLIAGFGLVIWLGPWGEAREAQQIDWLGYGMLSAALLALVALAAITGLSVNLRGGRDGVSASIDQDEGRQPMAVKTTVETTVTPAPPSPPADGGELPLEDRVQR